MKYNACPGQFSDRIVSCPINYYITSQILGNLNDYGKKEKKSTSYAVDFFYSSISIRVQYMSSKRLQTQEDEKVSVSISVNVINSLKKEFGITDNDVDKFVTSVIEKKIMEHIDETNSKVFSESETRDIEDDLKGLGYI